MSIYLEKNRKYLIIGPGAAGKSTLMRDLTGKHIKYDPKRKQIFRYNNVLFLAPNHGTKDKTISIQQWVNVLLNTEATAIVCYCPINELIDRLVARLKERWIPAAGMPSRSMLEQYFCKDVLFSYQELYNQLDTNKIPYEVVCTSNSKKP